MVTEKTIQICGKDVKMRYCAATETGFERITGQSCDVFSPNVIERDKNGEISKIEPPKAIMDDYIKLAMSAIIAAYARSNEESPVSVEEIIYDASPMEITQMVSTVMELRNKWYEIPSIIKPETRDETKEADDDGKPKNA